MKILYIAKSVLVKYLVCLALLSATIFLFSCDREKGEGLLYSVVKEISLIGEAIDIDLSGIGLPTGFVLLDSRYLAVVDSKGDYWVKIIDLEQNIIVKELCPRGRGPGEAVYIYGIARNPFNNKEFYINDAPGKKLLFYNVDSILLREDYQHKTDTEADEMFRSVLLLKDGRYFTDADSDCSSRYALFDVSFMRIGCFIDFPFDIDLLKGLAPNMRSSVFSCLHSLKPSDNRVAIINDFSDFFEILEIGDTSIISICRSYTYLSQFQITGPYNYTFNSLKAGFRYISSSDSFIYCSADRILKTLQTTELTIGVNTIYLFNWDGEPVRKYFLDKSISVFTVGHDDSCLYAFTHDKQELRLMKYVL